MTFSIIRPQNN